MQIRLRDPFAYPAGATPGFDPTHPASSGCVFSAIPIGTNFINLLTGKAGVASGTRTAAINGIIGPAPLFNSTTATTHFPGPLTIPVPVLFATIFIPQTLSQFTAILATSNTTGEGTSISWSTSAATLAVNNPGSSNVNAALPLTFVVGTPYFMAIACYGTSPVLSNFNFVATNLLTGKIYSKSAALSAGITVAASDGNYYLGASEAANPNANFATGMIGVGNLPSLAQLLAWAGDPWSFWYPNLNDDIFAELVGVLAVPSSSMVFPFNTDASIATLAVNVQATAILSLGS